MYLRMHEMCKIKKPSQGKHCITLPAASCEARNTKSRYANILVYGSNGVKLVYFFSSGGWLAKCLVLAAAQFSLSPACAVTFIGLRGCCDIS